MNLRVLGKGEYFMSSKAYDGYSDGCGYDDYGCKDAKMKAIFIGRKEFL